jgi:hypothetical protein
MAMGLSFRAGVHTAGGRARELLAGGERIGGGLRSNTPMPLSGVAGDHHTSSGAAPCCTAAAQSLSVLRPWPSSAPKHR